jgi:DNA-binding LacI/PurR family transcriptional regulator
MDPKPVAHQLKFKRIENEIRQVIANLAAGSKLPSERSLAESYNCNFLTVRRALKNLSDDGLIQRRVGSGTFVTGSSSSDPAPSLVQRENRVGVLVYQHGDDYARRVLQALGQAAMLDHLEIRSAWIDSFDAKALEQARQLAAEGCSVLTLPWLPMENARDLPAFVEALPVPVSLPMPVQGLENRCFEHPGIYGTSAIRVTRALCRYLRLLGHERIALLGPDSPGDTVLQQKLSGYSHYMASENLENTCGFVADSSAAMDRLATRWLKFRGDLAVVSYDDHHAFRFMTSMHKLGLSAPHDFAIVGYNDTDVSLHCDPALTTVRQDFLYIARWLLKSALALGRGKVEQSIEPVRLQTIVRGSCGGAGKIDAALREALPELELVEQPAAKTPALPALTM